jgi:hypothetical protein
MPVILVVLCVEALPSLVVAVLSLFSYQDDTRSNKHKIHYVRYLTEMDEQ